MGVMPIRRVLSSAVSAERANARYASRSPRFEPRAMYATSGIALSGDDHFSVRERAWKCHVRLSDRHPRTYDRLGRQHALRDCVCNMLEVIEPAAFDDRPHSIVNAAIIDELPVRHPRRYVNLQRLRHGLLVRQNADERMEAQTAQRDF